MKTAKLWEVDYSSGKDFGAINTLLVPADTAEVAVAQAVDAGLVVTGLRQCIKRLLVAE